VAATMDQHDERSHVPILVPKTGAKIKNKMPITPEFTALVTGHRMTEAYLYRFKLADDPMCPCNEGQQTSGHIIFDCNILEAQRSTMINH